MFNGRTYQNCQQSPKPNKSVWTKAVKGELRFLPTPNWGQTINKQSPSPEKVKAMWELNAPTNVPELRGVLVPENYFSQYLQVLSAVTKPLNEQWKSNTTRLWGQIQNLPSEIISTAQAEVLECEWTTMEVSGDASSEGLRDALLQQHGSKWRPVAFCSCTRTEAEEQYTQTGKEFLAAHGHVRTFTESCVDWLCSHW